MRKAGWIVLLGVPISTVVAATIAAQTYVSMAEHGHAFWRIFAWQWICWAFWAAVAPLVVLRGRSWSRLTLIAVALIGVHAIVTAAAAVAVQPYQPLATTAFYGALVGQLKWLLPIDVVAYLWLVLIGWALVVQDRARLLELRESRLEGDLARAQLEALRLEIQPHFLFNTLNAVAALIRQHASERALEVLIGLADLMRETLDRGDDPEVPLSVELDLVQRYVTLQRARFGDRLQVEYQVDPECRAVRVPAFVLQPIVENAIRHGVARTAWPCHILIRAAGTSQGGVSLSVADDGPGLPDGFDLNQDAHTGLRNIRARLEHLYGTEASLTIRARESGGVVTTVRIPSRIEIIASATA